jgi:hypothetical protein
LGATTDLKLWAGILIGPIAWTIQLLLSYPIAQLTCHAGFASQHPAALHSISVAALIAIGGGAFLSWQMHRQEVPEREQFMARLGLLTCALFALVVLATWVPPFIIHDCQA